MKRVRPLPELANLEAKKWEWGRFERESSTQNRPQSRSRPDSIPLSKGRMSLS